MNYFEFAKRSYEMLEAYFVIGEKYEWYNEFSVLCQQVVERFMKAIIKSFNDPNIDERIYNSHHLVQMAEIINTHLADLIDVKTAAWIEDFYFDAGYPIADFVVVHRDTALKLGEATTQLCETLIEAYNKFTTIQD